MEMLPVEIQNHIFDMKQQIEESEKSKKFSEYIKSREEHNKQMNRMDNKFRKVGFTFGKYKGYTVRSIALLQENHCDTGKQYLKWVSKNVDIKNELLKEAVEFYKNYYYHYTDGYD